MSIRHVTAHLLHSWTGYHLRCSLSTGHSAKAVQVAIYRCEVKNISRGQGRSCVAAAAYRHACELRDERQQMTHGYERKRGVEHSEIVVPEQAPDWASDRAKLWNVVDSAEKRKDARTAKEILLALPRELSRKQQAEAVRDFCRAEFSNKGLIADIAIHAPDARDGGKQPHAHVMVATRALEGQGLAKAKEGSLDKPAGIEALREAWGRHCNAALERAGLEERVDHRSLKAQRAEALAVANDTGRPEPARRLAEVRAIELDRQPEPKIGAVAAAMDRQGRGEEAHALREALVVRQERNQLRELGHELRQLVDQATRAIEAGRQQLAALWKRAEAALQRQREREPLAHYRAAVDHAQGDPFRMGEAAARLEVAEEYHAAGKNPRHHALAIITEADRRLLVATASPQIAATVVQQVAPQPDQRKVYEDITKEVDEQVNRIAVSTQKQAKERMHNAADIKKDARHKLTFLDEKKPQEPTGLLARFKRSSYEQELGEWQKERSGVKIIYDEAHREHKEMQQYAADFSNYHKTIAQIHAGDKIREINPELMKKFDEAKKEFEKQEEKERPVREAVQWFKSMARSRELRSYGYGDTGEHWRRIPDDLKSTIETFNSTPKDQRAAILEAMIQRLKLNPQALQATQRQLEQSSGQGLGQGRGR